MLAFLLATACVARTAIAYTVDPPTTAPNDTISDCTNWQVAVSTDTCQSLADDGFITLAQLYKYNPSLAATGCPIIVGDSYCIEQNFGIPPATTSSVISIKSSTSTGDGVSTPSPIQTGMVSNCDAFYLVKTGDSCNGISAAYGISLAQFYSWNPAAGPTCASLGAGDYVCVDIIGLVITTTSTSSSSNNGISTPQPIQTGMVSNCDAFYFVKSGDSCAKIVATYGIALTSFYAWNPAVGSSCSFLDIGDYVCVNIVGGTTLKTTTTTGNGITTPQPVQTGMVSNCDSFYFVKSGDSCAAIASSHGISLTQFYSWNPAVGSSCSFLDIGDYVCVDIVGVTPTTSRTSTKTTGNGVVTPTPTQTGMVTNCNGFHLVVTGDQCGIIATNAGITLAQFYAWNPAVGSSCATLFLSYYVCIGII